MTLVGLAHCGWIAYKTGGCWPTNQPTFPYNELSGFLAILLPPLITLAGIAVLWWWHNRCHVYACWWPARRRTAAGELACWWHHPHRRRTVADVHEAHDVALESLAVLRAIAEKLGAEVPSE